MALTGIYGHVPIRQAKATIEEALDHGITLFDTAPLYGDGGNEELLGEMIGAVQATTIITKFGLLADRTGNLVRDSSPAAIRKSVEASLRRLRRDRIDLLLQHRHDPAVPPCDVAGCVQELMAEGKVKVFGLSSIDADHLRQWLNAIPVAAVQNELSALTGKKIHEVQSIGGSGAVYIAHSPLGRGKLVGSKGAGVDDLRLQMPEFARDEVEHPSMHNRKVGLTGKLTLSPQAAISWVLDQGENVVAIPGCKSPNQIRAIIGTSKREVEW